MLSSGDFKRHSFRTCKLEDFIHYQKTYGQYEVAAYTYFTIITFFRFYFYQCIYGFFPV
jgi:hypothetical protein